jgi:hypothetical protein
MRLGPDAARYVLAAAGVPVPRPFNLRWLLPWLLGDEVKAWRVVWLLSWPLLAGSMFGWRVAAGDDWRVAAAAAVLLVGLPGILGPHVSIPVQVDLPATALVVTGLFFVELGHPAQIVAGVAVWAVAACISEKAPVVAALTFWSFWPLLLLVVPAIAAVVRKSGPDPLGPEFQRIADHPVRTALEHHAGRWRDGWLMVAPWGVCLAALVDPSVSIVVVLVVAYLQLLVATDTVRLIHHVAGPAMAVAAAQVIPVEWLLLAVVAHVVWFWTPERI